MPPGGAQAARLSHPDGLADGIARLRRALRRGARVADPDNSLAVAQLELLSALADNPGSRPGQLAHLLHMRPNTVTTIVNALAADSHIRRPGSGPEVAGHECRRAPRRAVHIASPAAARTRRRGARARRARPRRGRAGR
jgi:hypothetical protein